MRLIVPPLRHAARCVKPAGIPTPRPRGVKSQGLRYERAIAKAWPPITHGPWFEFTDYLGHAYCQPDFLLTYGGVTYVMEAKRTWTPEAHVKLAGLYVPVVKAALHRHTLGFQIAKFLTPKCSAFVTTDPYQAQFMAGQGIDVVLHWSGMAALSREAA